MVKILFQNKIYTITNKPYYSIHHQLMDVCKEHFSFSFYIQNQFESKGYTLLDRNGESIDINSSFKEKDPQTYELIIEYHVKGWIHIFLPYIMILLLSLIVIVRVDTYLSIYSNISNPAFDDFYTLLFILLLLFIIFSILFGSYYFMVQLITYLCQHMDSDIGEFMTSFGSLVGCL
jgi:hypothetical protein